jgi:hypothetical protein
MCPPIPSHEREYPSSAAQGSAGPMTDTEPGQRRTYNSLQKSIALTPRAPSAGPTGGEGVAFPAGTTIF